MASPIDVLLLQILGLRTMINNNVLTAIIRNADLNVTQYITSLNDSRISHIMDENKQRYFVMSILSIVFGTQIFYILDPII